MALSYTSLYLPPTAVMSSMNDWNQNCKQFSGWGFLEHEITETNSEKTSLKAGLDFGFWFGFSFVFLQDKIKQTILQLIQFETN